MTVRPNAYEQLTLELINRARMDPDGEFDRLILDAAARQGATADITSALRYFNVDIEVLAAQFAALEAVAPLAWNDALSVSATRHSQMMIDYDTQSHNLPGELGLGERVLAAGYDYRSIAENIFAYGEDPFYTHAAFFIDWGNTPTGIQDPPGHRQAIMDGRLDEIGIGVIAESNAATDVGPNIITHHIGTEFAYQPQLLGVVIDDADGDDFYDIGEGVAGVTITATGASGTFSTTSWDAGGYQLALAPGTYEVTFSGQGVDMSEQVTIGSENVKLDAETGTAGGGDLIFVSTAADESFAGGSGFDTAVYQGARADFAVAEAAGGGLVISGPGEGSDTLTAMERIEFSDGAYNLEIAGKAAGVPAATLDALVDLYIAYFNRVPEASGLAYWIDEVAGGTSLGEIAGDFYEAGVTFSSVTGYTASMSLQDFIEVIYRNVLDRTGENAPTQGEIDYWLNEVASGAVTREGLAARFLTDARLFYDDPEVGYVPELLDNKLEFGKLHAVTYGVDYLTPQDAIETTVDLAAAVTPTSIDAAVALVGLSADDYIA